MNKLNIVWMLVCFVLLPVAAGAQVPPGSDSSVVIIPGAEPEIGKQPAEAPTKAEPAPTVDATQVTTVTEETTVITKTVDPGYLKVTLPRLAARGPNLVSAGLGVRAGLSDNATGGFMFALQYAWQISRAFWLDTHFSANFGGRCETTDVVGEVTACGGLSGFGGDMLAGIMMQFLDKPSWDIPLNPYVRMLTGVSFIISNGPHDGAAIVVRGAGGLRYAFTDEFAVGAELGLMLGPSFRNDVGSGAFASFDFLLSAEYSF